MYEWNTTGVDLFTTGPGYRSSPSRVGTLKAGAEAPGTNPPVPCWFFRPLEDEDLPAMFASAVRTRWTRVSGKLEAGDGLLGLYRSSGFESGLLEAPNPVPTPTQRKAKRRMFGGNIVDGIQSVSRDIPFENEIPIHGVNKYRLHVTISIRCDLCSDCILYSCFSLNDQSFT